MCDPLRCGHDGKGGRWQELNRQVNLITLIKSAKLTIKTPSSLLDNWRSPMLFSQWICTLFDVSMSDQTFNSPIRHSCHSVLCRIMQPPGGSSNIFGEAEEAAAEEEAKAVAKKPNRWEISLANTLFHPSTQIYHITCSLLLQDEVELWVGRLRKGGRSLSTKKDEGRDEPNHRHRGRRGWEGGGGHHGPDGREIWEELQGNVALMNREAIL